MKDKNPKSERDAQKLSDAVAAETTLDAAEVSLAETSKAHDKGSIGPYLLIRKLGEGGMGQVWLAEQTAPLRRHVAIKLIKAGLYDDAAIERLKSERQSLAGMNHPAIAKVFDAGSTMDGQPYFVMEYVDGASITCYCDNKKLKIRERLELFIKICEGVQHAHQKAIIHRDLKPSNILVVEVDGKPVPRIIDFGIAKTISTQPSVDQTMFTRVGALVGTPGFMSPEQADPAILDVDTRTDIYSLGMTLYVLLAGTLPFDRDHWKKKPLDEVLRQLREEDPPSPSTKLFAERDRAMAAAKECGLEPRQLATVLRGDLDCITMKAIEKDRARRYGTPMELATDIQRYLSNEPVVARPASAGYKLQKYARRHRVGLAVALGAAVLLVAFAVTQSLQLQRIKRERDRANRITDFMTGIFKVSDPSEARGNTVTAREILDKASKQIETGLANDRETQAQLLHVMGDVYESLGLYSRARPLLERAVDIELRVLGANNQETLRSMDDLAFVLYDQGHHDEAEKLQRKTLDIRLRVLGREHPETLTSMRHLAASLVMEGRYAEAEKTSREALDIQRRVLGSEHPDTVKTINQLAGILGWEGHYAEAEKLSREALDILRRVLGPEHPDTLGTVQYLVWTLQQEGRYAEAEKLGRDTLDIQRRVLGPEHPNTLTTMNNLAYALGQQGHYAEAEKLSREALDIQRRVLGPEHPATLKTIDNLSEALGMDGQYAEAEKLLREAIDIQRRVLGPDNPDTAVSLYNLGALMAHQGRKTEALSLLRESIDHGLRPSAAQEIDQDPDLQSLHSDARFNALVAYAKEHAAAKRNTN